MTTNPSLKNTTDPPPDGAEQPEHHETLGSYLRQERLRRNLSLEKLAEATRINISVLQALEADDHHTLPAEAFVRGFIKICATHLDLETDHALALYSKKNEKGLSSPPRSSDAQNFLAGNTLARPTAAGKRNMYLLLPLLLVILGCLAYLLYPNLFTADNNQAEHTSSLAPPGQETANLAAPTFLHEETAKNALQQTNPTQESQGIAENTSPAAPHNATAQNNEEKFNYILKAYVTDETWLRIGLDGQEPQERVLQAGFRRIWKAKHQIDLQLRNTGGVQLMLNDTPLQLPGKQGEITRISIPDILDQL